MVKELVEISDINEAESRAFRRRVFDAQQAIKSAYRDKTNDFQHYDYVGVDQLVKLVKEQLASQELLFTSTVVGVSGPVPHGKQFLTTVEVQFSISDIVSSLAITSTYFGHGCDSGDKGIYKAYTGALKYYLFQFFQIPATDEPEQDSVPEEDFRTTPKRNRERERAFVPDDGINPWVWQLESGPLAGEYLFNVEKDTLRKIVGSDKASSNDRGYAKAALQQPTGANAARKQMAVADDSDSLVSAAEEVLGAKKVGTAHMGVEPVPFEDDDIPY